MVRHIRTVVVTAAIFVLGAAATAAAASDHAHGPINGIVPSRGQGQAHGSGGGRTFSKNLVFHGGSVLRGNTVYAIYWSPPGSTASIQSSYIGLINRFYTDVAAATQASSTANVYYADTQYGNGINGSSAVTLGSLNNASTFGGYFVDNGSIPSAYVCKDSATSTCVNDAGVVNEINTDLGRSGWKSPGGQSSSAPAATGNNIFFVFTAQGVGSCFGSSCSFTQWCAYHSNSGSLLYANMPFADTVASACDSGYHPNSSIDPSADATINVASHEHNETITDPFGGSWFDNSGNEIGDKCAWTFGSVSPNQANQTISGDPYILQREWSNYNNDGCVQSGV